MPLENIAWPCRVWPSQIHGFQPHVDNQCISVIYLFIFYVPKLTWSQILLSGYSKHPSPTHSSATDILIHLHRPLHRPLNSWAALAVLALPSFLLHLALIFCDSLDAGLSVSLDSYLKSLWNFLFFHLFPEDWCSLRLNTRFFFIWYNPHLFHG